jgi:hypothetical protein
MISVVIPALNKENTMAQVVEMAIFSQMERCRDVDLKVS